MFNNMSHMPFPFMGLPQMQQMMFPFNMQGMNSSADMPNGQQINGFPFGMMSQMPMMFPFSMQGMNNSTIDAANAQQMNGFPFGMMPQMLMMFPFFMQGMNNSTIDVANAQQMNGFPFGMMPQMPMMFPFFMQGMNNDQGKEDTASQDGFPFMGMTIPKTMLQKLLNMDWSPEELDKLQKVIDMIYAVMPKK